MGPSEVSNDVKRYFSYFSVFSDAFERDFHNNMFFAFVVLQYPVQKLISIFRGNSRTFRC